MGSFVICLAALIRGDADTDAGLSGRNEPDWAKRFGDETEDNDITWTNVSGRKE